MVLLAALAACAPIPSLVFVGADSDGGARDATTSNPDDSGGTGGDDGGGGPTDGGTGGHDAASDQATPAPDPPGNDADVDDSGDSSDDGAVDQPGDDGGDAAPTIKCGSALVADCVNCPGMPLRCRKGARDVCVADCTSCAANFLPCVHCATPTSPPHGSCVPIQANGQIVCTRQNLCACTADTDCLTVAGAAETCAVEAGKKVGCLTCGAPTSGGLACVSEGGAGVCEILRGGGKCGSGTFGVR